MGYNRDMDKLHKELERFLANITRPAIEVYIEGLTQDDFNRLPKKDRDKYKHLRLTNDC